MLISIESDFDAPVQNRDWGVSINEEEWSYFPAERKHDNPLPHDHNVWIITTILTIFARIRVPLWLED